MPSTSAAGKRASIGKSSRSGKRAKPSVADSESSGSEWEPNDARAQLEKDLRLARHSVEIGLEVIEHKTRSNRVYSEELKDAILENDRLTAQHEAEISRLQDNLKAGNDEIDRLNAEHGAEITRFQNKLKAANDEIERLRADREADQSRFKKALAVKDARMKKLQEEHTAWVERLREKQESWVKLVEKSPSIWDHVKEIKDFYTEREKLNGKVATMQTKVNVAEGELDKVGGVRCIACHESVSEVMTQCGHGLCRPCLAHWVQHRRNNECPSCRTAVDDDEIIPVYLSGSTTGFVEIEDDDEEGARKKWNLKIRRHSKRTWRIGSPFGEDMN